MKFREQAAPVVRVVVEGRPDEPPVRLYVEPWGEEFSLNPDTHLVVVFTGSGKKGPPEVPVSWLASGVVVCAEAGIDDYSVLGANGERAPNA